MIEKFHHKVESSPDNLGYRKPHSLLSEGYIPTC